MNRFLIGALMCLSALHALSQTPLDSLSDAQADSVSWTRQLGEVTVTASARRQKGNYSIIVPEAAKVKASTNGTNLIGRLGLPGITVNPLSNSVAASGGRTLELRINGVRANAAELSSLHPEDISRVEYHDAPEARYGKVDVVIDVITRRREGGNVAFETMTAVGKEKWASLNDVSLGYTNGWHSVAVLGAYNRMYRGKWIRDYEENRSYPGFVEQRCEVGSPVKADMSFPSVTLNYNYDDEQTTVFNTKLNVDITDEPFSEHGDRSTTLHSSLTDELSQITEHQSVKSTAPSLDLYFSKNLLHGNKLLLNVVGTYIHSESFRQYSQTGGEAMDFCSDVTGNKFSVIGEGAYEHRLGIHSLNVGARYQYGHAKNMYAGSLDETSVLTQNDVSAYAQYLLVVERWRLMANASVVSSSWKQQDGGRYSHLAFTPSVSASFQPAQSFHVRYRIGIEAENPTLDMLSDVRQQIDASAYRCGNPELKPYRSLNQMLSANYNNSWIDASLVAEYKIAHNPFMETISYVEDAFAFGYTNEKRFCDLALRPSLSIHPFGEIVEIGINPEYHRYESKGRDFDITKHLFRFQWSVSLQYKGWIASYMSFAGRDNYMTGTKMVKENNMSTLLAGYKTEKWSLQLGCFNPFMKKYWMKAQDWSPVVSSVSNAYCRNNQYCMLQFSLNLGFGRHRSANNQELNNHDKDSGIVHGTR